MNLSHITNKIDKLLLDESLQEDKVLFPRSSSHNKSSDIFPEEITDREYCHRYLKIIKNLIEIVLESMVEKKILNRLPASVNSRNFLFFTLKVLCVSDPQKRSFKSKQEVFTQLYNENKGTPENSPSNLSEGWLDKATAFFQLCLDLYIDTYGFFEHHNECIALDKSSGEVKLDGLLDKDRLMKAFDASNEFCQMLGSSADTCQLKLKNLQLYYLSHEKSRIQRMHNEGEAKQEKTVSISSQNTTSLKDLNQTFFELDDEEYILRFLDLLRICLKDVIVDFQPSLAEDISFILLEDCSLENLLMFFSTGFYYSFQKQKSIEINLDNFYANIGLKSRVSWLLFSIFKIHNDCSYFKSTKSSSFTSSSSTDEGNLRRLVLLISELIEKLGISDKENGLLIKELMEQYEKHRNMKFPSKDTLFSSSRPLTPNDWINLYSSDIRPILRKDKSKTEIKDIILAPKIHETLGKDDSIFGTAIQIEEFLQKNRGKLFLGGSLIWKSYNPELDSRDTVSDIDIFVIQDHKQTLMDILLYILELRPQSQLPLKGQWAGAVMTIDGKIPIQVVSLNQDDLKSIDDYICGCDNPFSQIIYEAGKIHYSEEFLIASTTKQLNWFVLNRHKRRDRLKKYASYGVNLNPILKSFLQYCNMIPSAAGIGINNLKAKKDDDLLNTVRDSILSGENSSGKSDEDDKIILGTQTEHKSDHNGGEVVRWDLGIMINEDDHWTGFSFWANYDSYYDTLG